MNHQGMQQQYNDDGLIFYSILGFTYEKRIGFFLISIFTNKIEKVVLGMPYHVAQKFIGKHYTYILEYKHIIKLIEPKNRKPFYENFNKN